MALLVFSKHSSVEFAFGTKIANNINTENVILNLFIEFIMAIYIIFNYFLSIIWPKVVKI